MSSIGINLAMMIQLYTEDHLYTPNEREALARQLIADSNIDSYEKYEEGIFALFGYIDNLRKAYRKARDAEELFTIQRRERLAIELLHAAKITKKSEVDKVDEIDLPVTTSTKEKEM